MRSSPTPTLLIVDGYNIIGAWPQLAQLRDSVNLESARHQLVELLTNYSAYRGYQTRIVFDAYRQQHPGLQEPVTEDVSVYYTRFGQTADACIERWCAQLQRPIQLTRQRLIVATSDQAQRHTVTGYGAEWMSAQRLASELNATVSQRRRRHRASGATRSSQRLGNGLNPGMQDRLRLLRSQLEH